MAISSQQAMRRFGYGPRGEDIADVRGALVAELRQGPPLLADAGLVSTDNAEATYQAYRKSAHAAKVAARAEASAAHKAAAPAPAMNMTDMTDNDAMAAKGAKKPKKGIVSPVYHAELEARQNRIKSVRVGFAERLVDFWANHFAISTVRNGAVGILAGSYEREAIRPHVLGKFEDMLLAVARHPAMLTYLDNWRSIGPNSEAGKQDGHGLNENLAREIMELHTVGVTGGYSQADVTAFARVLTGWTFDRKRDAGDFSFRAAWHEPGPQTVMGKSYAAGGVEQGEAVLRDLAHSPKTAAHIAQQFAAAFVADTPPQPLVDRLQASFQQTGGDLGALAQTLIQSDEAWNVAPSKLITPQEFLWDSVRCLNIVLPPQFIAKALRSLGDEPWAPGSPAGYAYTNATWLAPDSLTNRLDLAAYMTTQSQVDNPLQRAQQIIGPTLSQTLQMAIQRAGSRAQALTLLLMSSEFQRR